MANTAHLDIRLRIHFAPGGPPLGPGKIDLLEQISVGGSLVQAAAELGMSYRRAWALLQELAAMFGQPVVVTKVGGASGGGAQLTPFAHQLIASYRSAESTALAAVSDEFAFAMRSGAARRRGGARGRTQKPRRASSAAPSRH